ncbi:histone acetyltransferase [Photobacterium aquae]|uniref:Histone acetyltransferase n=2 Tax=Photobacterium aquae TaxID=1195763 RepID=A0A0J1H082_9GAMM|nr:histone acetyltransferase [Photobacterium aquae]
MERTEEAIGFVIPYSLKKHRELIESDEVIYLSIFYDDKLSGFMILHQENDQVVEFRRIVISATGYGLGQLAIKAMEQYCFQYLDCSRVWLDVFESNLRGLHIYKKLGYKIFQNTRHNGVQLLMMEKKRSQFELG